jgi:hypothetical protein
MMRHLPEHARLTSPTWATSSICSIYVNPEQSSLALRVDDDHGEALVVSVHRCGAFVDVQTTTFRERVPIRSKPSVRTQVTRIVEKFLREWEPARTLIGTGDPDAPELIDNLMLPHCWEARVR